jgi:hypothetical protein
MSSILSSRTNLVAAFVVAAGAPSRAARRTGELVPRPFALPSLTGIAPLEARVQKPDGTGRASPAAARSLFI